MYKPEKKQFFKFEETEAGIFGLFNSDSEIIEAAEKTKEAGFKDFDCLTPYPVHGLDAAMGLARSGIPWFTFFFGLIGCVIGFLVQFLTHGYDWPINISGKSLYAWYAYIPVTFEFTIFWAALASAFALFYLAKLPKINRKVLHPDITTDKFALWIPSKSFGTKSNREIFEFIENLGSKYTKIVRES